LIVDDEKIERNGIRFLLKKIVSECYIDEEKNGKAALEFLKKNSVDILLTDVKMPFMDGLELIEEVSKINQNIKIVIFSGYSEFEYAKSAMKLGVSDYILKPVDPTEFNKTIKRIISEIQENKNEKEKELKSILFYKEHLLYSLVNGTSLEQIKEKAEDMVDISFMDEYIKMFLIEFNKDFFNRNYNEFNESISKICDIDVVHLNLNSSQSLLFFKKKSRYSWIDLAKNIQKNIELIYNLKAYVAVSKDIKSAEEIPERMEELEVLMEDKFYKTEKHVFYQDESQSIIKGEHIQDDILIKKIVQDAKAKNIESLRKNFDEFMIKYKNKSDYSHVYIKFIFSNILKNIYDMSVDLTENELNNEINLLYKTKNYQELVDIIYKNIEKVERLLQDEKKSNRREVETVKQYIYEHCSDEISVEHLASLVYMAPSYLSYVFKKETGQNLCKFIKACRMEKAKKMLTDSNIKIVNIATMTGYANTSYFCQSFREYYGVSPQKYRNLSDNKGDCYEDNFEMDS